MVVNGDAGNCIGGAGRFLDRQLLSRHRRTMAPVTSTGGIRCASALSSARQFCSPWYRSLREPRGPVLLRWMTPFRPGRPDPPGHHGAAYDMRSFKLIMKNTLDYLAKYLQPTSGVP